MTKAETARKITNTALEEARRLRLADHLVYTEKIVNGKIRRAALKGKSNIVLKLRKKYSPSLVVDEFVRMGFEVTQNRKDSRSILTIKW